MNVICYSMVSWLTLVCEEVSGPQEKIALGLKKGTTNDKHKTMTWGYTTLPS